MEAHESDNGREDGAVTAAAQEERRTHWIFLAILAVVLFLPAFIAYSPGESTPPSVAGLSLPPVCMTQELFKADCPGCGLTRAFILIAHGEVRDSLALHRVGWILYLLFLYQFIYRIQRLRTRLPSPTPAWLQYATGRLPNIVVGAMILNWIVGVFIGGNGG